MESPEPSIEIETNGLYILISDIGEEAHFHWGLYLAKGPGIGDIFHMINNQEAGFKWQYQHKTSDKVVSSLTLIVALQIAVMYPILHKAIEERLQAVSTSLPITCRLWLKRALTDLDNEGYIKLLAKVDDIELEALAEVAYNKPRRMKIALKSHSSAA